MLRVAILGSGPSGLAAMHGAKIALGARMARFTVITNYSYPSTMYGAQYLHEPLPGLANRGPQKLRYTLFGSAVNYRQKVYGEDYTGSVSPEDLPEEHEAWDLRAAYQQLWERYSPYLDEYQIHPDAMPSIIDAHDLIISSVPANRLCGARGHGFDAQSIFAAGEAPEIGIYLPYDCPEFTVRCNALPEPSWYRISNIFGRKTVEWPGGIPRPPVSGAVVVNKPLYTNCDCWLSEKYLRVGRYGRWEKGVLVHDAFNAAYEWIGARC